MLNFAPKVTHQDVDRIVRRDFPAEIVERVFRVLDLYGPEKWHPEKDRVHLACLKLANGDLHDLQRQIAVASKDCRDVLAAAEYPGQFKIGFVGMDKLNKSNPSALEDLQRQDWNQYEAWLNNQGKSYRTKSENST